MARDFTAIFLSPDHRRALSDAGVALAVREPARLLAVTVNPTAPARPPFPAERLHQVVAALARPAPVFDVVADIA